MKRIIIALTLSLTLLIGVLVPLLMQPTTPVEAQDARVVMINTAPITTATNFDGIWLDVGREHHTAADIFISIDQDATAVNTMTLTLQVSADNSTFVNHSTSSALITRNAADANSYTTAIIHGMYYRIVARVANTNPVTPTIYMVLR